MANEPSFGLAETIAYRSRWRAINTFERLILGQLAPNVTTPRDTVFMWEQAELFEYELPQQPRKYETPILIVPPLMVKPTIFDLRPGHSMIGSLCAQGHHVFMVDYGIPTNEDRHIRVDDYVADFIPAAVEKICERTGADQVTLVGWSMGGIMSYMYGAMPQGQRRVRNLVAIGSPYDFSKMFPFNYLSQLLKVPAIRKGFERIGNIPPAITKTGFKLLDPVKTLSRQVDVVKNYWDRNWIVANETMAGWADDFIPYPGDAFMQFASEFVMEDKLRQGKIEIGGQTLDMNNFEAALLVIVGTTDKVAPPECVRSAYEELHPNDKSTIDVPLGHIGLISGSKAPMYVWEPIGEWAAARSVKR